MRSRYAWTLVCAAALVGCPTEPEPDPPGPPDISFRHADFYADVQEWAETLTRVDGDWKEDWGDGAFFGLAFYAREGTESGNEAYLAIADELYQRNLGVVRDQDLLTGDVNEIAMSLLGIVEYMAATGDTTALDEVDGVLETLADLLEMVGYYLPPEAIGSWAVDFYGPTSINALLALIFAQRALLVGGDGTEAAAETAVAMADAIDAEMWNGTYYDMSEERPGLFLYPGVSMILLHARLHQLTGDDTHRERALAIHTGIQPLRVAEDSGLAGPGRYRSPYSAEIEGAQTDDYSTLSAQNYLMMALMMLHEITDDPAYLLEVDAILDFVEGHLVGEWCLSHVHLDDCDPGCDGGQICVDGTCMDDSCQLGVLHHWIDGRVASPEDSAFVCSGCNLQLLYVMWYRRDVAP